ncbi:MAG: septum formation initiator family protein [bacterium]|nr:septum formation initiator family protein [bacterium]
MTKNQILLLSISILLLIALFIYIVFSRDGYSDVALLKQEQEKLVQKNEWLIRENNTLRNEINRLKNDYDYIENIARQELGMIRKDELILKPKNLPDYKK